MTGRLGGLGRWRRRDGQSGQINGDRAGQLWAAALEHAHVHPAIPCRKRKTQHCWRWLARHCGRPYQDECRGAFFSSQLKSAKGAVVGLGQPHHDGCAAMGVERLAGRPAGMGGAFGINEEQPLEGNARAGEGWRIKLAWRRNADGPAPFGHPLEQGQDQSELTDTGMGDEDLGERADRPALAGQYGIQGGMAGGNAGRCRGNLIATPHKMLQRVWGTKDRNSRRRHGNK